MLQYRTSMRSGRIFRPNVVRITGLPHAPDHRGSTVYNYFTMRRQSDLSPPPPDHRLLNSKTRYFRIMWYYIIIIIMFLRLYINPANTRVSQLFVFHKHARKNTRKSVSSTSPPQSDERCADDVVPRVMLICWRGCDIGSTAAAAAASSHHRNPIRRRARWNNNNPRNGLGGQRVVSRLPWLVGRAVEDFKLLPPRVVTPRAHKGRISNKYKISGAKRRGGIVFYPPLSVVRRPPPYPAHHRWYRSYVYICTRACVYIYIYIWCACVAKTLWGLCRFELWLLIHTYISCSVLVCNARKTPYDYNIKLRRSGPGTMLIETKSQIRRRRPVECSVARRVGVSASKRRERGVKERELEWVRDVDWERMRGKETDRQQRERERVRVGEELILN